MIYFFFLFLSSLFASDPAISMINGESHPSALVDGKVNAITGKWVSAEADLVIAGLEPIAIQRCWGDETGWFKEWQIFPWIDLQDKETNSSGETISFSVQEPSGALLDYRLTKEKKEIDGETFVKYVPRNLRDGYTNVSRGKISSRTYLQNQILWAGKRNKKIYLHRSDGTIAFFTKIHHGHYRLISEHLPNHRWILYDYQTLEFGQKYRYKKECLKRIRTTNPTQTIVYAEANLSYDPKEPFSVSIQGSDGQSIHYVYQNNYLKEIISSAQPNIRFQYFHFSHPIDAFNGLKTISLPNERTVEAKYYLTTTQKLLNQPIHLEHKYRQYKHKEEWEETMYPDPRCSRVMKLLAPVRENEALLWTHAFFYDLPHRTTSVYQRERNRTDYQWNEKMRLETLKRHHPNGALDQIHRFSWSDGGLLLSHILLDGQNNPLTCKKYVYNEKGDIIKETLFGNLSGKSPPLLLNEKGMPKKNGVEKYQKRYQYTPFRQASLLASVEEDNGTTTVYTYVPDTDLPLSETLYFEGKVEEKTSWTYDENLLLVEQVYKTEKIHRVKTFVNLQEGPYIGMPYLIQESFFEQGKKRLLQQTHLQYTTGGRVKEKQIFDAEGNFSHLLCFEYDEKGNLLSQTDPLGRKETFGYDLCGNRIEHHFPSQRKTSYFTYDRSDRLIFAKQIGDDGIEIEETYRYDHKHCLIHEAKPLGRLTDFTYDAFGRVLTKKRGEDPAPFSYTYDCLDRIVSETNPEGGVTQTRYNTYNQPISTLSPDGSIKQFEYFLDGRLAKEIDEKGVETLYTYTAKGNVRTKSLVFQGELLAQETFSYEGPFLLSHTDVEGHETKYSYDGAGRLISEEKEGRTVIFEYDPLGRIHRKIKEELIETFNYDLLGRLVEERLEGKGETERQIFYSYNSADEIETISRFVGNDLTREEFLYDSLGRVIQKKNPLGEITTITYAHTPSLIETTIDPRGIKTTRHYDPLERLIELTIDSSLGERVYHQAWVYNFRGDCLEEKSFLPSLIIHQNQYDPMGRLIQTIQGAQSPSPRITSYRYNLKGEKIETIKPDQTRIETSYDPLGNLHEKRSSDGTIHYLYQYDRLGRLLFVKNELTQKQTQKTYTAHGEISLETFETGLTLSSEYDRQGRRTRLALPDDSAIVATYGPYLLKTLSRESSQGETLYSHHFSHYDRGGHLCQENTPLGPIEWSYNLLGQKEAIRAPCFEHRILERDAGGNILVENIQGTIRRYAYDSLSQIQEEEGQFSHRYLHDAYQARLTQDETSYTLSSHFELTSHFSYDPNGNPLVSEEVLLVYDALDQLIEVKTPAQRTTYHYDGEGRRLAKTDYPKRGPPQTLYFVYDHQKEIGALNQQGEWIEFRLLSPLCSNETGAAVMMEFQKDRYLPIHDLYGNVALLLPLNGKSSKIAYEYSAFQEETIPTHFLNPWRFASKRSDPETGLIYFGQRYYCPSLGRWLTPDPAKSKESLNLYAFVKNNPLLYCDLYGLYTSERASSVHHRDTWEREENRYGSCVVGEESKRRVDYWAGIGTSKEDLCYATEQIYDSLNAEFAVHGYLLHSPSLPMGLLRVLCQKIKDNRPLSSLTPGLTCVSGWTLGAMREEETIAYVAQHLSKRAQDILGSNEPKAKQLHRVFSNANYFFSKALKRLTPEEKQTIAIISFGSTTLLDKNECHELFHLVGKHDFASKICLGVSEKWTTDKDIRFVEQRETKAIVGGHYSDQPEYLTDSAKITKSISDKYEIK